VDRQIHSSGRNRERAKRVVLLVSEHNNHRAAYSANGVTHVIQPQVLLRQAQAASSLARLDAEAVRGEKAPAPAAGEALVPAKAGVRALAPLEARPAPLGVEHQAIPRLHRRLHRCSSTVADRRAATVSPQSISICIARIHATSASLGACTYRWPRRAGAAGRWPRGASSVKDPFACSGVVEER